MTQNCHTEGYLLACCKLGLPSNLAKVPRATLDPSQGYCLSKPDARPR